MSKPLKEISDDVYRRALEKCWAVKLDTQKTFPTLIDEWITVEKKKLGVPYSYLAYPLLTSISYCLGVSRVKLAESYQEPVILYSLVSGRSGTNKSSCVSLFRNIINKIETNERDDKQHIFDSGTIEGLMTTLHENNGSVLCAVDEFSTFLDAMDKNSNGNVERSRYLSLWSGSSWSKKTKHGGKVEIEDPRFSFYGFNQNYFLINMIVNSNHFDGFLPRFLVATSEEEYVPITEKIAASKTKVPLCIQNLFDKIFKHFYYKGHVFELDTEAFTLFASYDQKVLDFRKADVFEDMKSMIMSKSIGNVLRVAALQCALRVVTSNLDADDLSNLDFTIGMVDMERAITLVTYSVNCLIALIDSTKNTSRNGRKRHSEMPLPEVMDEEFLLVHKAKIKKIFTQNSKIVPVSSITRNHMCPQIGGKNGSEEAKRFLKGLELNGLGKLSVENDKSVFIVTDKENIENQI
ncbi:uncharacterized protein [Clytia hemisphaerica]|uniref:uncharacterized protein n=1 Tax=Clytia hemisphaerica TaxID=252671 RepID=UPI0034D65D53